MSAQRVGFLLPHFRTGGAERVVLHWIEALDRCRWQPVLLLGRVEGDLLAHLPRDVAVIAIGGGRALLRPLRIARALAAQRIDVAYSATSAMNLALLAAPTKVPRIVSEHTQPDAFRREAKWPLLRQAGTRLLTRRAAAVAVPTAAIGEAVRGAPVVVVRNPVLREAPPPLGDKPRHGSRVVAAGRLVPAKGFDTMLEAAALLKARGVTYTLTIYGEGPLRDALVAQVARLGLGDHVTLPGTTDSLSAELAAAGLVVSSSRREGFGNVLIEAMAVGTPVLATRAGGPETFIDHARNGFLVAADDPAALADAIGGLLADADQRLAVREPARETAAHYTVTASVAEFEALLLTRVT
ncbi:glycosyltransferase [Sphingomonas radiodurans]|uniref:glycosyltransferase n=1 Tax=Sphingomonas radiodurans TaxID=2890321 RepID=UPI001E48C4C2|nr:glycosyltransferase [Sphingomonas radiodurans]WBH17823.1 glycosyltransferase [Sphingomonas radiodurans]